MLQNMRRKSPPAMGGSEALSGQRFLDKSEINQPTAITSHTDAQTDLLPAAAVATPGPPPSSPPFPPSVTPSPSAVQSLLSVDPQPDTETTQLELTCAVSDNAPEFMSIQELCFDAASFGISESNSKVSVVDCDADCSSSTSEHSSGPGLEVRELRCPILQAVAGAHNVFCTCAIPSTMDCSSNACRVDGDGLGDIIMCMRLTQRCVLQASDSGLMSADSEHLVMCQEIWKR